MGQPWFGLVGTETSRWGRVWSASLRLPWLGDWCSLAWLANGPSAHLLVDPGIRNIPSNPCSCSCSICQPQPAHPRNTLHLPSATLILSPVFTTLAIPLATLRPLDQPVTTLTPQPPSLCAGITRQRSLRRPLLPSFPCFPLGDRNLLINDTTTSIPILNTLDSQPHLSQSPIIQTQPYPTDWSTSYLITSGAPEWQLQPVDQQRLPPPCISAYHLPSASSPYSSRSLHSYLPSDSSNPSH
jgi:hypothetical protein